MDWDDLSDPVPMELVDPAFPEQEASGSPPGARSEILTREESEAVANMPHETDAAARNAAGSEDEPTAPTLEMTIRMPAAAGPSEEASGGTAFAGLRADMQAQAEAEKEAALKAEQEEASQQARLRQWMANAQARLLKADADLTGPGGRIRVRRENSPTLHRLAEMQKTMIVNAGPGGDATLAETPDARAKLEAAGRQPGMPGMPVDPMATIMVTKEQFLGLKPAPEKTPEPRAAETGPAKPEASFKTGAIINLESLPPAERASRMNVPGKAPMTREEALTRKIAQLREAAERPDKDMMVMMEDSSGRNALHLALAALLLLSIIVLGVCLFAATQSGMFDGLEDRFDFLRPNVSSQLSAQERQSALPPSPAPGHPDPIEEAAAAPVPTDPERSAKPSPAPAATRPAPSLSASGRSQIPPQAAVPVKRPSGKKAAKPGAIGRPASGDGETRSDGTSLSERILRSSLQSSVNIDLATLQEMYNRYALGFPGLSGEVVMGLTVRPDGSILEGGLIRSTTGVEAFDQELLQRVLGWRLRAIPESAPKFTTFSLLFPLQGR